MKNITRNAALLLVSILVSLLLVEGLLRMFGKVPEIGQVERGRYRLSDNELIGYEPVPGYRPDPDSPWHDPAYGHESNALGFRDYDHALTKPASTLRVLVIGDSIAMGYGIAAYEQTFPRVLENRLRSLGHEAEVINLGVAGFNTQQEVELLKQLGLSYEPDVVVLQYCMNDHERVDGKIMESLLHAQSTDGVVREQRLHRMLLWSALYRTLYVRYVHQAEGQEALEAVSTNTIGRYIAEFGRLARIHGFLGVAVVFPLFKDTETVFRNESAHATIGRVFRQAGVSVLDLRDVLAQCHQQTGRPVALDYYHPSAAAHGCAGEAIADYLNSLGVASN